MRWKGYVGRSAAGAGPAPCGAAMSTATPWACSVARAWVPVSVSSRSRRRTGTVSTCRSVSSSGPAESSVRQSRAMADRTPSGPSSRKVSTPSARRVRMPSWKRTARRACATQYSGVRSASPVASSPVRFDTTGTRGSAYVRVRATSANGSSAASMCGEWKAWLTVSRLTRRPRSRHRAARWSTASASPEITVACGPLTAAMSTRVTVVPVSAVVPAIVSSTSASVAWIAAIAPPAGSAAMSRPRAVTRRAASGSVSTPATWAAASSPTEWPMRASGRTPHSLTRWNSATSRAKRADWV